MDLKLIGDKKTIIVQINTELDHHAATEIKKAVDGKIKSSNAVNVIFDFSKVDFMDSSGIGVVLGRSKTMQFRDGSIVASHMNERLTRIFKATGLQRVVEIKEEVE